MVHEYPGKTGGRDRPITQQRYKLRAYKGQVLSSYRSGHAAWREQTPTAPALCWLAVIRRSFVSKEQFSWRLTPTFFSFLQLNIMVLQSALTYLEAEWPFQSRSRRFQLDVATVARTTGSDGKTSPVLMRYLNFSLLHNKHFRSDVNTVPLSA